MLSAYFSDEGAPIQQGAGDYFDETPPWAGSYRDGSLGQLPYTYKPATSTAQAAQDAWRAPGAICESPSGPVLCATGQPVATRRRRPGPPRQRMAGTGDYFDQVPPWAGAYKDGSFGIRAQLDENYPGPLQSFQDGSMGGLGTLGGPLFVNGEEMTGRTSILHDAGAGGNLGPGGGPGEGTVGDGGSLGPGAAETSQAAYLESASKPIQAYGDGVVGAPHYQETMPGGLVAYREGTLGRPGYFAPPEFNYGMTGLGAVASEVTLDLRDPAVVKEVRAAMVMTGVNPDMLQNSQDYVALIEDPLWGPQTTELFLTWLDWYKTQVLQQGTSPVPDAELAITGSGGTYPSAKGIMSLVATGVGSPGYPGNPQGFQTGYPKLSAFTTAILALGSDYSQVAVVQPYFTERDVVQGEGGGMKVSTMALIGLGIVAVVGGAVVFATRRKKRAA